MQDQIVNSNGTNSEKEPIMRLINMALAALLILAANTLGQSLPSFVVPKPPFISNSGTPFANVFITQHLEAVDLDGDGQKDLFANTWAPSLFEWQKRGGPFFFGSPQIPSTPIASFNHVAVSGDVQGDAIVDVIFAHESGGLITVGAYINPGSGSFGAPQTLQTIASPFSNSVLGTLLFADFDGDALKDIVVNASERMGMGFPGRQAVLFLKNNGNGTFGSAITVAMIPTPGAYSCIQVIDAEGDGDNDIMLIDRNSTAILWIENTGSIATGNVATLVAGNPSTPADFERALWEDLDGDGDKDIIIGLSNDIYWVRNDGGGVFTPQSSITTSASGVVQIALGDLDQDNDLDLVSISTTDGKLAWYQNQGNGIFGQQHLINTSFTTVGGSVGALLLHDVSGDGLLDIIACKGPNRYWYRGVLLDASLPGSSADLTLELSLDQDPWSLLPHVHPSAGSSMAHLRFRSPNGAYANTPPLLAAQAYPSSASLVANTLFPELHLSTFSAAQHPITVFYSGGPFASIGLSPGLLPPTGVQFSFVIPAGLMGTRIRFQGISMSPSSGNPIFTTTSSSH